LIIIVPDSNAADFDLSFEVDDDGIIDLVLVDLPNFVLSFIKMWKSLKQSQILLLVL